MCFKFGVCFLWLLDIKEGKDAKDCWVIPGGSSVPQDLPGCQ